MWNSKNKSHIISVNSLHVCERHENTRTKLPSSFWVLGFQSKWDTLGSQAKLSQTLFFSVIFVLALFIFIKQQNKHETVLSNWNFDNSFQEMLIVPIVPHLKLSKPCFVVRYSQNNMTIHLKSWINHVKVQDGHHSPRFAVCHLREQNERISQMEMVQSKFYKPC